MKQNAENNKKRNEMIENYETSIDKLKKTKNEKDNGNTEAMENELQKLNNKLDELKDKLSNILN